MFKRVNIALFVCFALLLLVMPVTRAAASDAYSVDDDDKRKKSMPENVIPGWVIVKFEKSHAITAGASKTGLSAVDRVATRFGVRSVQKMFPMLDALPAGKTASIKGIERLTSIYKLEIDETINPYIVASAMQALPEVAYAEPMMKYEITSHDSRPSWLSSLSEGMPLVATPNDALFAQQTHLTHIEIEGAWDVVKGEQGNAVVAILDGGTEWQHSDLQDNVYINPGEIANNGVDDDNNGLVDDVNGWNFSTQSNDPSGNRTDTPLNALHGTETAGIVAALTDNTVGVAGISWNSKVMPVNISCEQDDRSLCFSISGMVYSLVQGVDVVSASFGGPGFSNTVADLVETLRENGTLVVASAGNGGENNDLIPQFPANYDGVMSVGWTAKNFDAINSFSNYGLSVDVFAPGTDINSTGFDNQYTDNASGTSFAAPLVAGLAALLKTQNPDWTVDQIREQIRVTSDDISSQNNTFRYRNNIGKGRVNATRAVTETSPSIRILNSTLLDLSGSPRVGPGEGATLSVELINYLEPISAFDVTLSSSSSAVTIATPTVSVPALARNETASIDFSLFAAPDVPFNEEVALRLNINEGSYTDVDGFSVLMNVTNHLTGEIEVSLNEEGNLGYLGFQGETDGSGFRYKGIDYLFEGGIIMGTSAETISDNVRGFGADQDDDFVREEGSEFGIDDGRVTTEEGRLDLLDSQAVNPNNVRVRLDSYADTSDVYNDFVILRYTIENVGTTEIDDFHMGLFFDWDSPVDAGSDNALFDAGRQMGIYQDGAVSNGAYIGTKILNSVGVNYRAIDNAVDLFDDDRFSNVDKFNFISGGVQISALAGVDVSTLTSGGPFTIPVGGSTEIAFALVGGESLTDLNTHADAAQQLWDDSISGLGPNPVSNEDPEAGPSFAFALGDPYPNPVRDVAVIDYEVPSAGAVSLSIYDILGREVRTLVQETVRAGKHSVTWDVQDNGGRELASGMYLVTLSTPSNGGVQTETKKLVVLR